MEWLGLQLFAELPTSGQIVLDCRHEPFMVVLAYAVACAACFATLDMAERQCHSEDDAARRQWRMLGACCLAGGIWAMHFISMLAFQAPLEIHYDVPLTGLSLLIALLAAWLAMNTLDRSAMRPRHYLQAALFIGLGITLMHYVGMAALQASAQQYYQAGLVVASLGIAIATSLLALLMARYFSNGAGTLHLVLKYGASLLMAAGIVATHFTGMAAMTLVIPADTALRLPSVDNSLQLGLTLASITLLICGGSISAALSDKKLQSKERDLRRVNVLLSQLDQARVSLQQAAHYDALTNLVNRRGFNQVFAERLVEHSANDGMLAVMFLDIDHFKRINDSLGHAAGDELLKVIADHIKAATRNQDLVARFGGDEFCIVTSLNSRDEARHLAQRIMQRMKEPIDLGGRRMVMTTSIGISIFPDDGRTAEELLKNADLALYQSKGCGRNSLNFFDNGLKTRATLELQLEEELRLALLEECGLCVHYQPIFDLHNGQVAKLEALVRWQHPQHGLLAPDRFIGIAETNGLIVDLDLWVLRRACEDLARLNRHGYGALKVTVNCSAVTLGREELASEVEMALFQAGLTPRQLELEVTENALMGDIQRTVSLLKRIRAQGVALSIDDFGTGYSSLAYLKRLPLDVLKIDRSFIQDVPGSQKDREIVQAIIIMAHTLHLQVVCEGVETVEQHEFLAAHGCDFLQGYLLSRPVPLAELRPILERLDRQDSDFSPCCDTVLPGSLDLFADSPGYRASASIARRGH
ncbi:EAL domain-containing protein [Pseudomonas guariconensis]|uniref:putative bifunctional diguanylate cyclase/phosphodiesterase n=1 Tax=Pseudomonas TaxID=286 RepID=UPI001CE3D132|nr:MULTISPECIES: EAL domain-containing protein [Pseudomonas]MCO7637233.1 EAL domain-containing protein [Pseudomonas sp. S 311-6]MCO7517645.1 EAL domain-containing protein [Pseudomonas putida]MCO7567936.1 EAL domain-containing protein [Pseudomonas mosselii]MCO7608119.1 EAL domain-containing protein [Pseudomonas guariconensis]MCO7619376.1 EAL domain-containing protein [Pseudomonas guariconensis]